MRKYYLTLSTLISITQLTNAQPPVLVKDIYPGATSSNIGEIVKTSNYVFLTADDDDADTDRGLFRSDGTSAGTIKLNLTYPGYISTKAESLTPLGDKVIFVGDNFPGYYEIWSSNGTQDGTIALERFQPTNGTSFTSTEPFRTMAVMGNYVYYGVYTNDNHLQLRKTDGTSAGTSLVKDFGVPAVGTIIALFKVINNALYFVIYDGVDHIWKSDGTEAGTQLVKDIPATSGISSTFMPAGNFFYFFTVNPGPQINLWKSDGTTIGTAFLKTISTVNSDNSYPPHAAIGSTLYFVNNTSTNGKELWKTDGTDAGTLIAADITSGAASSAPFWLTVMHDKLFFSAADGINGTELWKYDGSNASMVMDIYPGSIGSVPSSLVVSNNVLFFAAADPIGGNELWVHDELNNLTIPILPGINPFPYSSFPSILTPGSPPIFFAADNGTNGKELYKYQNPLGCESLITSYKDTDADGFGNPLDTKLLCYIPAGFVPDKTDCNDNDNSIYPGAPELCDGKDNNCNGSIDESCIVPNVTINDIAVNESQGTATLTVSLSFATNREVTVRYRTVDGTAISNGPPPVRDFARNSGRLIFTPGTTIQNIIIAINADNVIEGNEYFDVELTGAMHAAITDDIGRVTIEDGSPTTLAKAPPINELGESKFLSVKAFPNPFSKTTTIQYQIPKDGKVKLSIYDLQGKEIAVLVNENKAAGIYKINFAGDKLAAGTYVCRMQVGEMLENRKIVVKR